MSLHPNIHKRVCPTCGAETMVRWRDRNNRCRHCAGRAHATHGFNRRGQRHPLYKIIVGMKRRCTDPRTREYVWYGARGISICDEWLTNYGAFVEWALSHGWKPGLQIDRIDNNGNYSPENCRFVTQWENIHNKRPRSCFRLVRSVA